MGDSSSMSRRLRSSRKRPDRSTGFDLTAVVLDESLRRWHTAGVKKSAGEPLSAMDIVSVNAQQTLLVSGTIDDWGLLRQRRVDTIVDLDGGIDPGTPETPNEILYIYFPILDETLPDIPKLEALGRLVADLVEGGFTVLVHCRLGLNRSNLLVGTALTYLGMDGPQALDHLRGIRPGVLYNELFADHVRALPARCRTLSRGA